MLHIGVVGTGMIGGSLIERLLTVSEVETILVSDLNPQHSRFLANKHEIVVEVSTVDDLASCDFIFVCTPVATIADIVLSLAKTTSESCVIVDTGSSKSSIVNQVRERWPGLGRFVPGHPIAGSHKAGPHESDPAMFLERPFVLTPYEETAQSAVENTTALLTKAGMKVFLAAPDEHDHVLASSSHLPHLIAFALNDQFDYSILSHPNAETLVAGSFMRMTTLAASDPTMWSDVYLANKQELLDSLARFKGALECYEAAIVKNDSNELRRLLEISMEKRSRLKW